MKPPSTCATRRSNSATTAAARTPPPSSSSTTRANASAPPAYSTPWPTDSNAEREQPKDLPFYGTDPEPSTCATGTFAPATEEIFGYPESSLPAGRTVPAALFRHRQVRHQAVPAKTSRKSAPGRHRRPYLAHLHQHGQNPLRRLPHHSCKAPPCLRTQPHPTGLQSQPRRQVVDHHPRRRPPHGSTTSASCGWLSRTS